MTTFFSFLANFSAHYHTILATNMIDGQNDNSVCGKEGCLGCEQM